jgi:hypothetical protein
VPDELPDPLAPPEGYGQKPGREAGGDGSGLDICASMTGPDEHCARPVAEIIHVGCLVAEHAGPVAYCAPCAIRFAQMSRYTACGQCHDQGRYSHIRVLRRSTLDGKPLPLPEQDPRVQAALDVIGFKDGPAGRDRFG